MLFDLRKFFRSKPGVLNIGTKLHHNQSASIQSNYKMTELTETQIEEMIDVCDKMLDRSYCIYSKFPVAAALVTDDGKVFSGCNIENSSYGLAICAERTAAVKAVSEGSRKFKACFVKTRSDRNIGPCGACRQFLYEFGPNMTIYLVKSNRQYITKKLKELLPLGFDQDELDSGVVH